MTSVLLGNLIGYGLNRFPEIADALDGIQPGFYHLAVVTNIGKKQFLQIGGIF